MRHELTLEGEAFRLRPVEPADSAFITNLRNDPTLGRFINASADTVEGQRAWIKAYLARDADYYFIVENRLTGEHEGTISIYNVDSVTQAAEWGRWILKPGSMAAVESALLIYRAAFDLLGLETLYCRTLAENKAVVSFHDSSGLERVGSLSGYAVVRDEVQDAIEHRLSRALWPTVAARLDPLARRTAQMLARKLTR